jgi:hypothetical protein
LARGILRKCAAQCRRNLSDDPSARGISGDPRIETSCLDTGSQAETLIAFPTWTNSMM